MRQVSAGAGRPDRGPVRVLLCDRNAFSRLGMRTVLGGYPALDVVGEAADGAEALAAVERLRPDVVLADVGLPDLSGAELARRVLAAAAAGDRSGEAGGVDGVGGPEVTGGPAGGRVAGRWPAVVLMVPVMDGTILDALRAGASAILVRDCPAEEFVRAIQVVAAGDGFLAPPVVRHLVDQLSGTAPAYPSGTPADALTRREREVLALVADGLSNAEIGQRLLVGEATVKYHVSQLLRKLDLRDRLQAAAYAYRNGLVVGR